MWIQSIKDIVLIQIIWRYNITCVVHDIRYKHYSNCETMSNVSRDEFLNRHEYSFTKLDKNLFYLNKQCFQNLLLLTNKYSGWTEKKWVHRAIGEFIGPRAISVGERFGSRMTRFGFYSMIYYLWSRIKYSRLLLLWSRERALEWFSG